MFPKRWQTSGFCLPILVNCSDRNKQQKSRHLHTDYQNSKTPKPPNKSILMPMVGPNLLPLYLCSSPPPLRFGPIKLPKPDTLPRRLSGRRGLAPSRQLAFKVPHQKGSCHLFCPATFSAPNFRSQTSRIKQRSLHYLRNANCVIGRPATSNHLRCLNPETEEAVGDEERAVVPINDVPLQQTVHRALHVRG